MEILVTAVSTHLYSYLLVPASASGTIHSVYRNTVNLMSSSGQLLALQAAGSQLSPISLLLPLSQKELEALSLSAGNSCRIKPGEIILHSAFGETVHLRISPAVTRIYDSALPTPETPQLSFQITQAQRILRAAPQGSFGQLASGEVPPSDLLLSTVQSCLGAAAAQYARRQWNAAAQELCALVGLGIGLTPSGDDFLCGLLAGLLWMGGPTLPMHRALSTQLAADLTRTNPISAAFLDCALRGQFSEAMIRFFALSADSSAKETETCEANFRAIGHTSGFDSLFGILYALTLPAPHA